MENKKLHTPEGVTDFLPEALAYKRRTEALVEGVFAGYGYRQVASPAFEYVDVFTQQGAFAEEEMIRFLDNQGHSLALRVDMTTAIARLVCSNFPGARFPLRLSYITDVFRQREHFQGKRKQSTQAGVELIGAPSDEATAEIIAVAAQSVLAAGLHPFRVDLGSVEFFRAALGEAGLDSRQAARVQAKVLQKDYVSAEALVREADTSQKIKGLFAELPLLAGPREVLAYARHFVESPKALAALGRLGDVMDVLACHGLAAEIQCDLSMIGNLDYYNDVIFKGYTPDTGTYILNGGRYDNLYPRFGQPYAAVGAAIEMDVLVAALGNSGVPAPLKPLGALVAYSPESRAQALAAAAALRAQGQAAELFYGTPEAALACGDAQGVPVRYYKDGKEVALCAS